MVAFVVGLFGKVESLVANGIHIIDFDLQHVTLEGCSVLDVVDYL